MSEGERRAEHQAVDTQQVNGAKPEEQAEHQTHQRDHDVVGEDVDRQERGRRHAEHVIGPDLAVFDAGDGRV